MTEGLLSGAKSGQLSLLPHFSQKVALVFTEAPHEEQNLISEAPKANGAEDGSRRAALFCLRFNRRTTVSATATTTTMSKAHGNKEVDCVVEINSDAVATAATLGAALLDCLGLRQNSER